MVIGVMKKFWSHLLSRLWKRPKCVLFSIAVIVVTGICLVKPSTINVRLYSSTAKQDGKSYSGTTTQHLPEKTVFIAIGGGITSSKISGVNVQNIADKFVFLTTLMPSFCRTIFGPYQVGMQVSYHFYLAYDDSDPFFSVETFRQAFADVFHAVTKSQCPTPNLIDLKLVECEHQGRPAWAQNDAMIDAYLDGADYFYRINDDTVFVSSFWAESFITALSKYTPANVGVVGPTHDFGNMEILTHDFVHRTHIEIFGFYYPRIFTDWFADDWITYVYAPEHITKLKYVQVEHRTSLGRRYYYDAAKHNKLYGQLQNDREILARYIYHHNHNSAAPSSSVKVIAMTVPNNESRYTFGAIRNAQLIRMYFPDWVLRVYVPAFSEKNSSATVPQRVIDRIESLGGQVIYVGTNVTTLSPAWWSYLVADDVSVDYFMIRHADARLSERDSIAVSAWIHSKRAVHCIRDNLTHFVRPITDGLWGGKNQHLYTVFGNRRLSAVIKKFVESKYPSTGSMNADRSPNGFLSEVIWPVVMNGSILCHDVSPSSIWPNSVPFPVSRLGIFDVVDLRYNSHEQPVYSDNYLDTLPFDLPSSHQLKLAGGHPLRFLT